MSTYGSRTSTFLKLIISAERSCEDYGPISQPTYSLHLNGLELSIKFWHSKRFSLVRGSGYLLWHTPWFLLEAVSADPYFREEYISGDYPDDQQQEHIAELWRKVGK